MIKKIFIILLCTITLTGCYNYREIENLGIISAIGISKTNDNFNLTIQIFNTQKSSDNKEENPKFLVYSSSGKTIQEGLRNILEIIPKRLFINHTQLLIIDEETAKNNMNDIVDFFYRETEARKQFSVLIAKSNIEKILSTNTLIDKVNGKNIKDTILANNDYLGTSINVTYEEFLKQYLNKYSDYYLPVIELENVKSSNDEVHSDKILRLNKAAIFKNNKLVGYLNEEETKYLNILNDKVNKTIITNDKTSIETTTIKTSLECKKNIINVKVKIIGNIADITDNINLTDSDQIKKIESTFEEKIKNNLNNTMNDVIRNYDSDALGIKGKIYKSYPQYIKNSDIKLSDLSINYDVYINLITKGNGDNTIEKKYN